MTSFSIFLTPVYLFYVLMSSFFDGSLHDPLIYHRITGFPSWYMLLSYLMIPATTIFFFYKQRPSRKTWISIIFALCLASLQSKSYKFLSESDELHQPKHFRSSDLNKTLLYTLSNGKADFSFDTDSKPLIGDCGASSSATFCKDDFIPDTYRVLSGVTISGIASGLEAAGIGSVLYKISDDNGTLLDLQIDRVLHLKQLPQRLISPQQVLKQHYSPGDGFFMYNTHSILKIGGHTKTISYDPLTNLPIFYTKSGVDKLYNLTHDSDTTDNLSKTQKELLHWHRRLGHMDFEKIKDLSRQGLLPKELSTCKSPLCSFCIQAKQQCNSITSMATGGAIKSGNLKPGSKISCDQYYSREPGFIANNNGLVLSKESAKYGTLFVDHASDFIFHFLQTSPDGSQTVDAKHKFETFAKNCGVDIRHYHADNKIFNNQLFKESCITAQQTQSFCGVSAHHQNGVAERKIKSVINLARAMLFNAMIRWPDTIHLSFWPYAVHYATDILNNTPKSSGFSPKEIFTGIKGDRSLRHFHTFGSPAFVLHPTIANGKKLPTWKPRSKPAVFLGKSRQHASNVSLVYDPSTHHISPQFYLVHDDEFQTVSSSNNNELPNDWKDILAISHYSDDEHFTSPLQATIDDKSISVNIRSPSMNRPSSSNTNDPNISTTVRFDDVTNITQTSEGAPEGASEGASEGVISNKVHPSASIINSNDDSEDAGSIAQGNANDTVTTRSGRNILRLKRYLQTAVLGLLSSKIGSPISSNSDSLHSISILKAQTDYENILNILPDGTNNKFHPLAFMAS